LQASTALASNMGEIPVPQNVPAHSNIAVSDNVMGNTKVLYVKEVLPEQAAGDPVRDVEAAQLNNKSANNGAAFEGVRFTNVPKEAEISIYTINGELLKIITVENHTSQDYINWDCKTDGGRDVSSGLYIWIVRSGKSSKTGKLVVVK